MTWFDGCCCDCFVAVDLVPTVVILSHPVAAASELVTAAG
jgi:hypothetical protein